MQISDCDGDEIYIMDQTVPKINVKHFNRRFNRSKTPKHIFKQQIRSSNKKPLIYYLYMNHIIDNVNCFYIVRLNDQDISIIVSC